MFDVTKLSEKQIENFRTLFHRVCNTENWKLPTKDFETTSYAEAKDMKDAITFFVGGAEIRSIER